MWLYKKKKIQNIEDFGEPIPTGFVYVVTHILSGKKYFGKKILFHNTRVKIGKKELAEITGKGRRPYKKLVTKESDWKTYYGSNKQIMEIVESGKQDEFKREILHICYSKKQMTYLETKLLFVNEVLEKQEEYYNDHISGHFYRKDLEI